MRYAVTSLCLVCLFTLGGVRAQESEPRAQYVPAPREVVLPVVVAQPDSPLQFEKVERLIKVGGGRKGRIIRRDSTAPDAPPFLHEKQARPAYAIGRRRGGG